MTFDRDCNALYHAGDAIQTLLDARVISETTATKYRMALTGKLSAAIDYYQEKGFSDVVEGLNNSYRRLIGK